MPSLQFLYLISTGNDDSIYKVGISDDPKRRLEQIKDTYNIPRAFIVETMDVETRAEVLALENAIHTRFTQKRSTRYGGREFFKFSREDLGWVLSTFNERSNDFAQAKAYYGLHARAESLSVDAKKLERQRQDKIGFNRRNGKRYDTKPNGTLKEYNDLVRKMANGHLGERFSVKNYEHPAETLSKTVQKETAEIIDRGVGRQWVKCSGCGFVGGLIISSSTVPDTALSYGFIGLFFGAISGAVSQANRSHSEKLTARKIAEEEVDKRYPGVRQQKMVAMLDFKSKKSFLIRDFSDSTSSLRQSPALLPRVDLPSQKRICDDFSSKNYFPTVAVAVTLGFTLLMANGHSKDDSKNRSTGFAYPVYLSTKA